MAAKVAAFLSLKFAEYKYTERGNPIVATKVDKAIITEYPPMMKQLSDDIRQNYKHDFIRMGPVGC